MDELEFMEFGKGVFEVKATSGDTRLGGTDMDQRLLDYLVDRFNSETGMDLRADNKAMARLREAAEIAKIELSTNTLDGKHARRHMPAPRPPSAFPISPPSPENPGTWNLISTEPSWNARCAR